MNFDDELAKLHEANDADTPPEAPPETPPVATPAAPVVAAPAEPAAAAAPARVYSLDDPLPDIDDIAPSFRGKPLRALLDDRRQAIAQRDEIGRVKNDHESENRVLKSLLQVLIERQPPAPTATETPKTPTLEERIRTEQLDSLLNVDSALALGRTAELAAEAVLPQINGQIAPLAATVNRLEAEARDGRIFRAHTEAGRLLNREQAEWKGKAEVNAISAAVLALQLPLDDPQSYVKASRWIDDLATIRTPKSTAAPPPAAPAPTTPLAPVPPAGTGAAAAPPAPGNLSTLSSRDQETLDRMRKNFEDATGRKMPKDVWENTYQRVAASAPRRRSA